ncbi:MAG: hypothetical protein WC055_15410, partial [Melioribacteraceae bacterium]
MKKNNFTNIDNTNIDNILLFLQYKCNTNYKVSLFSQLLFKTVMPNTRNKKNTISHPLYRNAFLLRRGDVIYTSISYDGVRYRETTNLTWHQSNFKLAERILEAKLQALMNPQVAIENQSIEVLFNQYLDFKAKSVTSSAIKKYKQAWNNWIQFD